MLLFHFWILLIFLMPNGISYRHKKQTTMQKDDLYTSKKILQHDDGNSLSQNLKSLNSDKQGLKGYIKSFQVRNHKLIKQYQSLFDHDLNETMNSAFNHIAKTQKNVYKKIDLLNDQVQFSVSLTQEMLIFMYEKQLQLQQEQMQNLSQKISQLQKKLPVFDNTCSQFKNCQECTQQQMCGWCELEQQCIAGDNVGGQKVNCEYYQFRYCGGKTCGRYNNCTECLQNENCGWCKDQFRQLEVCIEKDQYFKTKCPSNGWLTKEKVSNLSLACSELDKTKTCQAIQTQKEGEGEGEDEDGEIKEGEGEGEDKENKNNDDKEYCLYKELINEKLRIQQKRMNISKLQYPQNMLFQYYKYQAELYDLEREQLILKEKDEKIMTRLSQLKLQYDERLFDESYQPILVPEQFYDGENINENRLLNKNELENIYNIIEENNIQHNNKQKSFTHEQ